MTCYPDRKVEAIQKDVVKLEKLYKAFVRKMLTLDPTAEQSLHSVQPYRTRRNLSGVFSKSRTADAPFFFFFSLLYSPFVSLFVI